MLDINRVREDPEAVRRSILDRQSYPVEVLDELLSIDAEWKSMLERSNSLKHRRNVVSQEISGLEGEEKARLIGEMREVSSEIKSIDERLASLDETRGDLVLQIPNVPHPSVPVGKDEAENVTVRTWGEPRDLGFEPKPHFELAEDLDIIDFQRGAKVAGSGFYVLKGDGARLERALINYMLDTHARQGYREVFPPVIVNQSSVVGTGQWPKLADDMYQLERDGMWLNPTAEVPVTNLHADEILDLADLPIRYTAYLPSFRREAGRHSDTRGIIRVHQFNKVEMVRFVEPSTSYTELESLTSDAEEVLQGLGIPYRVQLLCTGDLSFAAAKCFDIEGHAPGHDGWLEISSCSNFEDFQARRAHIKYRPEPHLKSLYLHTINGSGLALPRTMVCVLENNQNADGTIAVPEILRPYLGGQSVIG